VHLVAVIKKVFDNIRMHGMEYFKITDAQKGRLINNYKNATHKLLKTNMPIWLNKIFKNIQLTPKYVNIKMKGNNRRVKGHECSP